MEEKLKYYPFPLQGIEVEYKGENKKIWLEDYRKFSSKYVVDEKTGCWEWTGRILSDGYPGIDSIGFRIRAHRFSYLAHNGEIDDDLLCCHKCDNIICVSPFHIWQGSQADNMKDCSEKGRKAIGEAVGSSVLNKEIVGYIRSMKKLGATITQVKKSLSISGRKDQGTTIENVYYNKTWKHLL